MMARLLNSKFPRAPRACRPRTYSPSKEQLLPARSAFRAARHNLGISSWLQIRRLALPDVLTARARDRLCGIFLCHRLPADGAVLTPHIGPAFPQLTRRTASGRVLGIDHHVEFFHLFECSKKSERFPVGCYRPG